MLIIASISRFCLIVCLCYAAPLCAPMALSVVQTDNSTKTTQRDAVNSQNAEVKSLYELHQWFKLRSAVKATKASAFYRGAVASAFNDVKQAEKNLQSVITSAPRSEQASEAHKLLTYVYQRAGRYRQALSEVEAALATEPNKVSLINARALFSALSQFPEQSIAKRRFSRTRYSMKDGNLFLPVEINGRSAKYIADTGANFSIISEAEAKRLGLTIHGSGGSKVGDSAGVNIDVRLAVADQLTVGHVRLRHVIFFVMRDDQQPFVNLACGERGVLGLPVLLAFQTLRWKREGTFEIGFASGLSSHRKSDICFEGAQPVIEAEFRGSKINIFLDTGATKTRVLPLFAREFAGFVEEFGGKDSARVTGVSGSVEVDAITLPELTFRISGFDAALRPAQVLLKETTSDSRWWHVWIALDLVNQARVVTIDFESMRLALE
jgi:predicted aspartyl protease